MLIKYKNQSLIFKYSWIFKLFLFIENTKRYKTVHLISLNCSQMKINKIKKIEKNTKYLYIY